MKFKKLFQIVMGAKDYGHSFEIFISRFMSTWWFIFLFMAGNIGYLYYNNIFAEAKMLDAVNLKYSLYTIFVELIILKASLSIRDIDKKAFNEGLKIDKAILKEVKDAKNPLTKR